jgi:predicted DNA-binding transcriptional regulator YafY
MARHEKALDLLRLALEMQASGRGLSLAEIEEHFSVGRRTAERMRDAVRALFPMLEERVDQERVKRWKLPSRAARALVHFRAEELAALDTAAGFARAEGRREDADHLDAVAAKVRALLDAASARRLEPDVSALCEAEGLAMRPGARPLHASGVVEVLREAVLGCRVVQLDYRRSRSGEPEALLAHPYGFLHGNKHYLVAKVPASGRIRILPLTGIRSAALRDAWFERPEDFDLARFAERSFGVFQEEPYDVVWRFAPDVAEAARAWHFHPSQRLEPLPDGSLLLRFRAGGLEEMAFHVFTWAGRVEVLAPQALRELLREWSEAVAAVHEGPADWPEKGTE